MLTSMILHRPESGFEFFRWRKVWLYFGIIPSFLSALEEAHFELRGRERGSEPLGAGRRCYCTSGGHTRQDGQLGDRIERPGVGTVHESWFIFSYSFSSFEAEGHHYPTRLAEERGEQLLHFFADISETLASGRSSHRALQPDFLPQFNRAVCSRSTVPKPSGDHNIILCCIFTSCLGPKQQTSAVVSKYCIVP